MFTLNILHDISFDNITCKFRKSVNKVHYSSFFITNTSHSFIKKMTADDNSDKYSGQKAMKSP